MKSNIIRKTIRTLGVACLLVATTSQAGLINRGNGMIYDDVLDVTWLQDANYAGTSGFDSDGQLTWASAQAWANQLSFGGFEDWRLPTISPIDDISFDFGFSFDGSTDRGFNSQTEYSELAHMFYNNLGNTSYFDTFGNAQQPGSEMFKNTFNDANTGELFSFDNIGITYWTGLANNPIVNAAFAFNMRTATNLATGEQQLLATNATRSVWALRDGDVMTTSNPNDPIPQASSPAIMGLFSLAMLGMMCGYRRLFNASKKILNIESKR